MDPQDIRRWIENYRAAQELEALERRAMAPSPQAAISSALDLIHLAGRMHGWPLPQDPARQREDELGWANLARLRSALRTS